MHLSLATGLPLLCTLLPLTTAQRPPGPPGPPGSPPGSPPGPPGPPGPPPGPHGGCSIHEPTSAYQIYSSYPDVSIDLSTRGHYGGGSGNNGTTTTTNNNSTRLSPRVPNIPFAFHVSQGAGNTDRQDLVVAFAHLPCYGPGPFSFEFNFVPQSAYFARGQGQINMFRVDNDAPRRPGGGPDNDGATPTWNSIEARTGSLVGTFELPKKGGDEPKLLFLNQLVCQEELVLRFGITQYSAEEGSVAYLNRGGMGLRERSGC